jgi:hypothetical protein
MRGCRRETCWHHRPHLYSVFSGPVRVGTRSAPFYHPHRRAYEALENLDQIFALPTEFFGAAVGCWVNAAPAAGPGAVQRGVRGSGYAFIAGKLDRVFSELVDPGVNCFEGEIAELGAEGEVYGLTTITKSQTSYRTTLCEKESQLRQCDYEGGREEDSHCRE